MRARRAILIPASLGLIGAIVAGCSVGSPSSGGSVASATSPSPKHAPATDAASPSTPQEPGSVAPTEEAPPSGSPEPDPTLTPPPDASLAVDGGDPVVGEQGTWSWHGAASDAPWLPGYPIHVAANERLTFSMSEGVPIDTWEVSRVIPSGVPGGDGAIPMAEGTGADIVFAAPPSGRWSVAVLVRFGDHLGDAVYYWAVTVD